jgi:hypothetical protein
MVGVCWLHQDMPNQDVMEQVHHGSRRLTEFQPSLQRLQRHWARLASRELCRLNVRTL